MSVSFIYSIKLSLTCVSLQCALLHCLNMDYMCVNLQRPDFQETFIICNLCLVCILISHRISYFLFSEHTFPDSGHFVIPPPPHLFTVLFLLVSCSNPAHLLKQCFSHCGPRNTPASEYADVLVKNADSWAFFSQVLWFSRCRGRNSGPYSLHLLYIAVYLKQAARTAACRCRGSVSSTGCSCGMQWTGWITWAVSRDCQTVGFADSGASQSALLSALEANVMCSCPPAFSVTKDRCRRPKARSGTWSVWIGARRNPSLDHA